MTPTRVLSFLFRQGRDLFRGLLRGSPTAWVLLAALTVSAVFLLELVSRVPWWAWVLLLLLPLAIRRARSGNMDLARLLGLRDREKAAQALLHSGIKCANGDAPKVRRRGSLFMVETPHGYPDEAVAAKASVLRAALRSSFLEHDPQASCPGLVCFRSQRTDVLRASHGWTEDGDLTAVRLGITQSGDPLTVSLDSATVLIGGSPGSGKSVALWNLMLAAALDPTVCLVLIDLKPLSIETANLHYRAERVCDTSEKALAAFKDVEAHIWRTNRRLLAAGLRKVTDDREAWRRVVIFVDEAAQLAYDKTGKEAYEVLQRIVAVGRASGVTVVLATQKPDSTAVPTGLRDLIGHRLCFRVGNSYAAETVLGKVPQGVEPWLISPEQPGVGFSVVDGLPVRFRAAEVHDEVAAVASRVANRRWVDSGLPAVLVDDDVPAPVEVGEPEPWEPESFPRTVAPEAAAAFCRSHGPNRACGVCDTQKQEGPASTNEGGASSKVRGMRPLTLRQPPERGWRRDTR